jgi:hypothetical protein
MNVFELREPLIDDYIIHHISEVSSEFETSASMPLSPPFLIKAASGLTR